MYDCNNKGNKKQVKEAVSNIEAELDSPCKGYQGMYFLFLSLSSKEK